MINILNTKIKQYYCNKCPYGGSKDFRVSFSQEGEDLMLDRLFNNKAAGFYVDVGAHHPKRFSNTYFFYLRGWRGVNIDAMPGSMELFNSLRPQDINLEFAISDVCEEMTFYIFNETALNTFCRNISDKYISIGFSLRCAKQISTQRLRDVLDIYLPVNQAIDFLNVDVEGLDLAVLESNNWSKYNPTVVLIEELNRNFDHIHDSKIANFMKSHGYKLYCKAINTLIFVNPEKLSHL